MIEDRRIKTKNLKEEEKEEYGKAFESKIVQWDQTYDAEQM